jgi:hypothetical protein
VDVSVGAAISVNQNGQVKNERQVGKRFFVGMEFYFRKLAEGRDLMMQN